MSHARQCFNTFLNKAFIWSARSLAVAAVMILGKSDDSSAKVDLGGTDELYAQETVGGDGQISYVEVGETDEDGDDWPPPLPT